MITIKNKNAIEKMTIAGRLLAQIFEVLPDILKPGISTLHLDSWIEAYLKQNNLVSSSKGYMGYKHASCISINDEVVHGVPEHRNTLKSGDLVKIDVCASYKGYCADMARCFFIDQIDKDAKQLVDVAVSALQKGIEQSRVNKKIGDISAAIETEVSKHGYGIVREFAGHGIGINMHEDPEILNYGEPGIGPTIKAGMSFAIEPMITMGDYRIFVAKDGWTVKTVDKSLAAHVEDTVIVTENEPLIITRL